jgi:hypothetical protein
MWECISTRPSRVSTGDLASDVCERIVSPSRSSGCCVTNNSDSRHLRSIEVLGRPVQIGRVHPLLAAALVIVRIYNYAAVPPAELNAARADADRIFQDAGLHLQWIECRVPNAPGGDLCTDPLNVRNEFVLRLQAGSHESTRSRVASLGSSLMDDDIGGGVLITIDPRAVHSVAAQAGVDPSTVLGRAIAHELGHLLIGRPRHASQGLMRAFWSQAELRRNRPVDWRFSAGEGELMRRTLARGLSAKNETGRQSEAP